MRWGQHHKFRNTDMITTNNIPTLKTYRLMYFFGTWVTKSIIPAECDNEAIFDADDEYSESNLNNWQYPVALWCGNRKVKEYNNRSIYGK